MNDHGLSDLWHGLADALGDRPAVSCGATVRTWSELDRRAARLAAHLLDAGLRPGDRVAIGLRNSVEHVEVFFALVKAGLTPVNLNVRYRAGEVRHVLTDSGARGLIVHASAAEVAAQAAAGTSADSAARRVVVTEPRSSHNIDIDTTKLSEGADAEAGFVPYETVLAGTDPLARRRGSADDQIILYTGGTTGAPKGTVWSHRETMGIAAGDYRRRGHEPPETLDAAVQIAGKLASGLSRPVIIPASPLMHGTGFYAMLGALAVGGEAALLAGSSFSAEEMWHTVARRRVTDIVITGDVMSAPMVAELRRAAAAGAPHDLSSLRTVRSAGMRWSRESKLALLEFADIELLDVLASSEGGPYGLSRVGRGDNPQTARFLLAPGARVLTADGRDVVPGSGEVGLLAAPGRMPLGYLGDADKSAQTFRLVDGVRYSVPGDLASLAPDGSLVLLGRGSSVINSGGEKIHAEELENVLVGHPAVRDAVVVAVEDERFGQSPAAIVTIAPGSTLRGDELRTVLQQHVREHLASYKKPRQVLFVDEIVRTAAGKADRRWAQEFASSQADAPAATD